MGQKSRRSSRLNLGLGAVALIAAVGLGPGCGLFGDDTTQTATQPAQQTKPAAAKKKVVAPKKKKAVEEEYTRPEYPNMTRRNPFQPDVDVIQPAVVPAGNEERALSPLEQYSLSELSLVAIISEVAVPKAMFVDPDGFGHVVKEGDHIGRNGGVVSDIRNNEVEIREKVGDEGSQTRLRTVKLRKVELKAANDQTLTDDEKKALQKLLSTDQGRKALQAKYRDMALGASAAQKGQQGQGQAPPADDARFPGLQPPSQNNGNQQQPQ